MKPEAVSAGVYPEEAMTGSLHDIPKTRICKMYRKCIEP